MNSLKTYIKGFIMAVTALSIASCSSDPTPIGTSVPNVGTVTLNGKNYVGIASKTQCFSDNTITLSQSFANGEAIVAIVFLGDTPKTNKTYNIETNSNAVLAPSNARVDILLTGPFAKSENYRPTSGTIQASIEDGKVVIKYSNIPAKIYNASRTEIGTTIIAAHIKCNN